MDVNKNSVVEKGEFVKAVLKLRMAVSASQIEQYFDAIDRYGNGCLNYEQFMEEFDRRTSTRKKVQQLIHISGQ